MSTSGGENEHPIKRPCPRILCHYDGDELVGKTIEGAGYYGTDDPQDDMPEDEQRLEVIWFTDGTELHLMPANVDLHGMLLPATSRRRNGEREVKRDERAP